jgi:site-specific DNA-methyltransferase (cytosine-N4-specific)
MAKLFYRTTRGRFYLGDSVAALHGELRNRLKGKVQLILTSPPFPLNKKKKYGNKQGDDYKQWFTALAEPLADLLTDDGSIIIEMGNAWQPGRPVQSLLHLEALLGFVKSEQADLRLCQQFVCYNPSRLPSPAQWVTIKRVRVTDSFTHVWWMAKCDNPQADNRLVLRPYSKSMSNLLRTESFNAGARPSQHRVSPRGFLRNNGGSIMPNVLELDPPSDGRQLRLPESVLSIAHTQSNDFFLRTCRARSIQPHPARMPLELASFFIRFVTKPGDLVFDPFAGSNTTGFCAERMQRKWFCVEADRGYAKQSLVRFEDPSCKTKVTRPEQPSRPRR